MLLRYWSWTSAPPASAESGLPFGPLRYRAWTSAAAVSAPATSGLPFGALRYRAWTSANAIIVPPVGVHFGGSMSYRLPVPDRLRALQLDDEDVIMFVVAWVTAEGNK